MAEISGDDFGMLGSALTDLYQQARPRSDIGGSFGSPSYLGTKPVATFMGRMVRPGEGLADILRRLPTESPDAEGMGGIGAILAGAPVARRVGGKIFREASSAAPAVREMGGKFFADMPAPHVAPWQEIVRDLVAEGPIPRSTLRPAIKTESGIISGDVLGGHGRLWESVSPAQRKGAIDGYVDRAGRFMTRDQGTIASGSLEGIKRAYQNALAEY